MRIPLLHRPALVIALALLALSACATPSGTQRGGTRDPNLITVEELEAVNASNLLDAVNRLRPQFLRSRGVVSLQDPNPPTAVVYLDGQRVGGIDFLERMSPLGVISVRYMTPVDASSRYGFNHEGGAILVSTRRSAPQDKP
jgi:hypothetical protein